MATNLAPIEGVIELKDEFTSTLGLADAALSNFSKHNQESLKATAEAAGLVTAAVGAIAAVTIELGRHGAEVADVDNTLEHFAGSAKDAANIMQALRDGTKGTVDNFVLAKDAAHLLSAGVKLTADDFSTLGQAAFVLQNRGLGGTKEQLELVSDALVTGRTRALAMAVGVVDATDAEQKYADKLGLSKDQLSATDLAEAKRIAVLDILNRAVKDAGQQERDFGEQLEAAKTRLENWTDDLAKSIAQSPVFAAGMKAIGSAFNATFGDDNQQSVSEITHLIEQGAIRAIDFAQVTITAAKGVESAWYVVKSAVLAVETAVVGVATVVTAAVADIAQDAAALHIISPGSAAEVAGFRDELKAMTVDLASQTAEAAKSVVSHTALDDTLDGLSNTLSGVQKAMIAATGQTKEHSDAQDIAAHNAHVLAEAEKELNAVHGDQAKIQAELVKSTKELNAIWEDYFVQLAKDTGTSEDGMRAQIEKTFQDQVDKLNALDPLYKEKYALYQKIADEALANIDSDWGNLSNKSQEHLQEIADAALEDYNRMLYGGLTFSREVLDAQLEKWRGLQDAAAHYGQTVVDAQDAAAAAAAKHTAELDKQAADLERIKQLAGGSREVTSTNFEQAVEDFNHLQQFVGAAQIDFGAAIKLAKQGYSFQDIVGILMGTIKNPGPPAGPRIPGFAEGGTVMVGEEGPEIVRLPLGSTVFPTGMSPNNGKGGGITVNNVFNVNGTAADVAKKVGDHIMGQLKLHRQFGTA